MSCGHLSGPLLIASGAALFACTNAASTAFYRGGGTIITLYLIRCVVIYLANGAIVALREGQETALRVLVMSSGRFQSSWMAYLRGVLGSTQAFGLNLSLVFTTFADAFTVFVGISNMATILISHTILDNGEHLSFRELACGGITLSGMVLIAQPPLLFGESAVHYSITAQVALAIAALSGTLSAGFGVLTRVLTKAGSSHAAYLSPAMLLSHKLLVMFVFFACVGLVGHLTHLDQHPNFQWMQLHMPKSTTEWALVGLHCAFTLFAQLALAAGYATTRAGIGGFLQVTAHYHHAECLQIFDARILPLHNADHDVPSLR